MKHAIVITVLYPLLFLCFEVQSKSDVEGCKSFPVDKVVKHVYEVKSNIKLMCDTSDSADHSFRWDFSSNDTKEYTPVFDTEKQITKYRQSGNGLDVGSATVDKSGLYCCQKYSEEDGTLVPHATTVHAVLVLHPSFRVALAIEPYGAVKVKTEVTLKCLIRYGHGMSPFIEEPIVVWKLPDGMPKPKSTHATEYKFKASKLSQWGRFQCTLKYPGVEEGGEFPSNTQLGQVWGH